MNTSEDEILQAAASLTPKVAATLHQAMQDPVTAVRLYLMGREAHDPVARRVVERVTFNHQLHPRGASPHQLLRELRAHESPLVLIIERVEQLVEARAA